MVASNNKDNTAVLITNKKIRLFAMLGVLLSLPLIYALVYYTGGITYVYSHTMYLSILIAGIFFGPYFGLVVGIISGILLGPFMPLNVALGTLQEPLNWIYRLLIFSLIGFLSGYASFLLQKNTMKIHKLSSINPETGIPNTNSFLDITKSYLHKPLTLFTILINNVDNIIDILGIDVFHQLLKDMYFDLSNHSRKISIIQPDRNKLWAIMEHVNIESDLTELMTILSRARTIHQIPLFVDYSVGVSAVTTVDGLISINAFSEPDIAARHAQINNIQSYIFDDGKMKRRSDYELVAGFANALLKNETFLMFQPKIDLITGKTTSIEALIRWEHPTKGTIMPDRFIPLIEETKLIHQLTDWVLDRALLTLEQLHQNGFKLGVSINVSAMNLFDPRFYERAMDIIHRHGVDCSWLEFEITETELMKNPTESKIILTRFSQQGVKISIDDFGSGYSSLAYLTQFPINTIKIDKFFLIGLLTNPQIKHIVNATVSLSKDLGYQVVAEGVEDQETASYLQSIKCDYAQGYYYARPLHPTDLIRYLNQ